MLFRHFDKIFIGGLIGYIFITIFKINLLKSNSIDIDNLIVYIFGNINIESNNFLMNYSNYIYNYIIVTYICSNYIYINFNKNAIYIFTRTNEKNRWINKNIIEMSFIIAIYFIIQYIAIVILGFMYGFKIIDLGSFSIITICVLSNLLVNSMIISLIANIISFKSNDIIGYSVGISVFSLCILIPYIFNLFKISNIYYKYIPFINSITSWYESFNEIIDRELSYFNFYLNNHNFIINMIINLFLIFILQFIIKKLINKMDIL